MAVSPLDKDCELDHPYFHVRIAHGVPKTNGLATFFAGHRIERNGTQKPDGIFAAWCWDGKRLQVFNDRYGFYPLFYFLRDGEVAVSTSILRLLAEGAPFEFDEPGLAVFLRLGFFIGDDTPFRAIRAVPPDAMFEWQDGKLEVRGRLIVNKPARISRDDAIDGYISLFRAAIKRRVPPSEDLVVPLSGGRDSRHILLELLSAGYSPRCVTFKREPPMRNWDAEAASQLAKTLKLDHVVLEQPRSRVNAELRKNLKTQLCSDEHTHYLVLLDYLKERLPALTLYDGIAGDVLSAGSFSLKAERLALFESARFDDLAQNLFAAYTQRRDHESFLSQLLCPKHYNRFGRALAISHLSQELVKHAAAANPPGSFTFWNRTRREIALVPYSILRGAATVFSPFLDHELYDFLSSLPTSMLLDHEFHTDTIRRAYPKFADIPFADQVTVPANQHRSYFRHFAGGMAWHFMSTKPSHLLRYSFMMPRLVRGALGRHYGGALFTSMGFQAFPLYLHQLEIVMREAANGDLNSES
jgi:hypothetical protein